MEAKFADVPDQLWERIAPLLPPARERGRPPRPDRRIFAGIVYRLRTGCQWKALPQEFGSGSTCHRRFQTWRKAGLFERIFMEMLRFYDKECGILWEWASLDGFMGKAPKGGTSPVPTLPIAPSAV